MCRDTGQQGAGFIFPVTHFWRKKKIAPKSYGGLGLLESVINFNRLGDLNAITIKKNS